MTLCYSRERAEKFSTRDRWCMNHFVRTVNGERVVSQIQNDFTVSLVSLDVLPSYHGGTP